MDIILFKWALNRKRMQLKLQMDHSSCRLRLNLQKTLCTYKMYLRLQVSQQRDAFESAVVTCRHCPSRSVLFPKQTQLFIFCQSVFIVIKKDEFLVISFQQKSAVY